MGYNPRRDGIEDKNCEPSPPNFAGETERQTTNYRHITTSFDPRKRWWRARGGLSPQIIHEQQQGRTTNNDGRQTKNQAFHLLYYID